MSALGLPAGKRQRFHSITPCFLPISGLERNLPKASPSPAVPGFLFIQSYGAVLAWLRGTRKGLLASTQANPQGTQVQGRKGIA